MKKFNILGTKNNIKGGLLKNVGGGGFGQFGDLGGWGVGEVGWGAWQERGGGVFEGERGLIPRCTL